MIDLPQAFVEQVEKFHHLSAQKDILSRKLERLEKSVAHQDFYRKIVCSSLIKKIDQRLNSILPVCERIIC